MSDQWARRLRLSERELVIDAFRLVMQSEEFRHRHVDDVGDEIIAAVVEWFTRVETAVSYPKASS